MAIPEILTPVVTFYPWLQCCNKYRVWVLK